MVLKYRGYLLEKTQYAKESREFLVKSEGIRESKSPQIVWLLPRQATPLQIDCILKRLVVEEPNLFLLRASCRSL